MSGTVACDIGLFLTLVSIYNIFQIFMSVTGKILSKPAYLSVNIAQRDAYLFHDGGLYHIETSLLTGSANQ